MTKFIRLSVLSAFCLALLVTSFSVTQRVSAQSGKKICFAYQDLETQFWVAGHQAIVDTLKAKGIEVIERNGNQDANKQLEQVKDCITQGVDGIIIIPQDSASAVTIAAAANEANIPIAVFNRPPSSDSKAKHLVVVADNQVIAKTAVDFMVQRAVRQGELGGQVTPLIMVGDLGDTNAVGRLNGFKQSMAEADKKYPGLFKKAIEVPTKWDANTGLANLQAAMKANPDVDFIFTSSDFLFPQIQAVLEPLGKWVTSGKKGHVILGGLDGDAGACKLMKDGYLDTTGVQDLYFEANSAMDALLQAIANKETQPNKIIPDPGFALTQENIGTREMDMWGCKLLAAGFLDKKK